MKRNLLIAVIVLVVILLICWYGYENWGWLGGFKSAASFTSGGGPRNADYTVVSQPYSSQSRVSLVSGADAPSLRSKYFPFNPLTGIGSTSNQRRWGDKHQDASLARRNSFWDLVSTWGGSESDQYYPGDKPSSRQYYREPTYVGSSFPLDDFPEDVLYRHQLPSSAIGVTEKFQPKFISEDAGISTGKDLSVMDDVVYDAGPWWKTASGDSQSSIGQYAGLESSGGAFAPSTFAPPNTWYQPSQPFNDWRNTASIMG